jgi:mono/diheme cytochrome c family protein
MALASGGKLVASASVLLALSSTQKLGIALAAGAFVVFALVSSMLIPRYRPNFPSRHLGWFIALCVLFTVGMLATVIFVAKETGGEEAAAVTPTTPTVTQTTETTPTETTAPAGDAAAGRKVFATAGCTSCHTLQDAGSTGTVGPNLDDRKPSYDKVIERVTNGKAPMPPFAGTLTPQQIANVAAYVSSVAGT